MSKLAKALTAAAGNAGESLYVEDVFSTYLYEGNGTGQTITNGIDLNGEGGLVWFKSRTDTGSNVAVDTERGGDYQIYTNSDNDQDYLPSRAIGFNADGFSVSADIYNTNKSGQDYASWTFRKAEKFFDVVTYAGNGTARTIAHNLGSKPAVIIIKAVDKVDNWMVYHDALVNPQLKYLVLQSTNAEATASSSIWNTTQPTDSVFSLGSDSALNGVGYNYVAYLFASDAGGFGDDGDESIIKCGSYTGDGVSGKEIDVGFEPQWVMVKASDTGNPWAIMDIMRGANGQAARSLQPNSTSDEQTVGQYGSYAVQVTATGFKLMTDDEGGGNGNGNNYIYIAIRRPMKTPESGTEVFAMDINSTTNTTPIFTAPFAPDFTFASGHTDYPGDQWYVSSRLTGNERLNFASTSSASNDNAYLNYFRGAFSSAFNTYSGWMFKCATGFFDVVAYTGDGSARTINHNLGATPELMIVKSRTNGARFWMVYSSAIGNDRYLVLNDNWAQSSSGETLWNSTNPTSDVFSVGAQNSTNENSQNYIAYLFATLDGVSKVGSYTGTGADLNVDCGFSAGARFILIKRTDSTGDWYVWDSERGIVAGNDPYLLLNSTAAEVTSTDYIDPLSSGFTVTSSAPAALNASGGNYIFLAIA